MCRFVLLLFISVSPAFAFTQSGIYFNLKSGIGFTENFTSIENNHRFIYSVNDLSIGYQFQIKNHPKLFLGTGMGIRHSATKSETETEEIVLNSNRIYGTIYSGFAIKNNYQIVLGFCIQNNRNVNDFITGQAFNYRSNVSIQLNKSFKQNCIIGLGYRRALTPFNNPYFLHDPANFLFLNFKLLLLSKSNLLN